MPRFPGPLPLLLIAGACASEPDAPLAEPSPVEDAVDCSGPPNVSWANWGEGFFRNYCTGCHSSQNLDSRFGAPIGVNFDEEAPSLALAARVRARVLESHDMPSGGGIPADDLVLLQRFLDCAGSP